MYRTLIFVPTVLSVVIIGFIWQLILNPLWGVSEGILKSIGLGALYKPWLGLEPSALLTLSLISVWQFVGIPMVQEASIIFSHYRGADIWYAPIPNFNSGGMAQHFDIAVARAAVRAIRGGSLEIDR